MRSISVMSPSCTIRKQGIYLPWGSRHLSSLITIAVEEFHGSSRNELFKAVNVYLGTVVAAPTLPVEVGKGDKEKALAVAVDVNEEVTNMFEKVELQRGQVLAEPFTGSCRSRRSQCRSSVRIENVRAKLPQEAQGQGLQFVPAFHHGEVEGHPRQDQSSEDFTRLTISAGTPITCSFLTTQ